MLHNHIASIHKARNAGVRFIQTKQRADGSFLCGISETRDEYHEQKTCPAIVPSNIVLSSLCQLPHSSGTENITYKTAQFLLGERGSYWSFNYWFRSSKEYKTLPYPDDVDDTFCALAALYDYDPSLFTGEVLAHIATMLVSAEKAEGGPYDMWLVPPEGRSTWNDTDFVVNSNVGYFLSQQGISLPGLEAFIEEKITAEGYAFPYCSAYPALYFASRFYRGPKVAEMRAYLRDHQESSGMWENPLMTALAVCASLRLGCSDSDSLRTLQPAIVFLLETQRSDGGWDAYSFFYQMRTRDKTLYAGSETITTALALEALTLYERAIELSGVGVETTRHVDLDTDAVFLDTVRARVLEAFGSCEGVLFRIGERYINDMYERGLFQMVALFMKHYADAISGKQKIPPESWLIECACATVHGWIAYGIYDDFYDAVGDVELLPVAQVSLRMSQVLFGGVAEGNPALQAFITETFLTIDNAHAEEHRKHSEQHGSSWNKNTTVSFEYLAHKSLGHMLGPLLVLGRNGYTLTDREWICCTQFFKNYLIARQLDDDIHDWEEDMEQGNHTPVTQELVRMKQKRRYAKHTTPEIFWNGVAPHFLKEIELHCTRATLAIEHTGHIIDRGFFDRLIVPILQSVERANHERAMTLDFISTFTQSSN